MVTQEVQRQNALREILSESKVFMKWFREETAKEGAKLAEKKAVQARRDERIKLLTRQLESLYGKLPKWEHEKIAAAPASPLEKWMMRLLKAKSLEEVLR